MGQVLRCCFADSKSDAFHLMAKIAATSPNALQRSTVGGPKEVIDSIREALGGSAGNLAIVA